MPLAGTLIIENFNYGTWEDEFGLFEEEDKPLLDPETGEQQTLKCKVLSIQPHTGLRVEVRVPADSWASFLAELSKSAEATT